LAQPVVPFRERTWPEPRRLDLELDDTEKLSYKGYFVTRREKKITIDDYSIPGQPRPAELEVSYAALSRKGKFLATFENDIYHPMGNTTRFGLFTLLGTTTRQVVIGQTIWKGGRHWVVSLFPRFRIVYSSREWSVGDETFSAIDLDNDGVDEILESVRAFYDLQDRLAISQIPTPTIVFKYDRRADKYFPANRLHEDYLLRDIERRKAEISKSPRTKCDQLGKVLDVTLSLIYAGDERGGWEFYDRAYQFDDKQEIKAKVRARLNEEPVYRYMYRSDPGLTTELSLPKEMSAALDRRFPGWDYAPVEDEIRSFLKEEISSFARPDLVCGDFDGEGTPDYAVLISQRQNHPDGGAESTYLVVFLQQGSHFTMHIIDPDGAYLCVMPRGEWDYDFEMQAFFTYANDAILAGIFEKGGTSYVYEKGKFRAITTGD